MAWGNWDVRVHAASSAMRLAQQFANTHPAILDDLEIFVRDPVRTVRLQIAQSVNGLWDVARERMWGLADYVTKNEPSIGVVAYFIGGPLHRIVGADAARAEQLLSDILDRIPVRGDGEQSGPNDFYEAAGNLAAWLCVTADNARAWARFGTWVEDLVKGDPFLWAMLFSLRGALFLGYRSPVKPEDVALRGRAKRVLERVVAAAVDAKQKAEPILRSGSTSDADKAPMEALYVAGDRLLGHACNQFYFGSGTFRQSAEESPWRCREFRKASFLAGLSRAAGSDRSAWLGAGHSPPDRTLCLPCRGVACRRFRSYFFHPYRAGNCRELPVRGAGRRGLGLACSGLSRRLSRSLRNPARRARLVAVLESFSSVGWPDALSLLYELPELLR